jgi:hypothetical protein
MNMCAYSKNGILANKFVNLGRLKFQKLKSSNTNKNLKN